MVPKPDAKGAGAKGFESPAKRPDRGRGSKYDASRKLQTGANQKKPPPQTIDNSSFTFNMPEISKVRRVSPLAASWRFGLQPQGPTTDFGGSGSGLGWVALAGVVLFAGAAIWILRD